MSELTPELEDQWSQTQRGKCTPNLVSQVGLTGEEKTPGADLCPSRAGACRQVWLTDTEQPRGRRGAEARAPCHWRNASMNFMSIKDAAE